MKTIKIVTINTWKCDGDYYLRINLMAQQLRELNPDIVACQECYQIDDGKTDTLKFLAAHLNMNYSFLPGRFKSRFFYNEWVNSFSGLGILSAYPIAATSQFSLPAVPQDDDRKAQHVAIILPDGRLLSVTNIHLTHLQDAALKKEQAEALAAFVTTNSICNYNLVCGDFNAVQGSETIDTFMKKTDAIDCYTAGNGHEPRYSLIDAFNVNKLLCVDHLFALPLPGENNYPEFVNSAIVLNVADRDTGLYPSDHFGISTELVIG